MTDGNGTSDNLSGILGSATALASSAEGSTLLIVGRTTTARLVKRSLEADVRFPGLEIILCSGEQEALALLAARAAVKLVLLLWQDSDPRDLRRQVMALSAQQDQPTRTILVRSEQPVDGATKTALWHLGVADLCFAQTLPSEELNDTLATLLRDSRRLAALAVVSDAAGRLARAVNLRNLAALTLDEFHRLGVGRRGSLFIFRSGAADGRLKIIAASGSYGDLAVMPLEALADASAAARIYQVMQARRSEFAAQSLTLFIATPDGYEASIYLVADGALASADRNIYSMLAQTIALSIDQTQLAHRLLRTQHATITTMATLAEYRDVDTGEHVARVARAATEIAQALLDRGDVPGIDANFVEHIGLATILHDIGKIAVAESILMKPGPLDVAERRAMQAHATLGRDILLRAAKRSDNGALLLKAAEIACHHHERFDGQGYPAGLSGAQIPLAARIVALVDVFDALTSLRPYKQAWPVEQALALIREEAGKHFDPRVVEEFLRLEEERKAARFVEWEDSMSVGNSELNLDHQRLLATINRLWLANSNGNRQVIEFVLDDLVNYTEFHFQREERLLALAAYPDYEKHCAVHATICRRLEDIRWEYFQGIHDELRNEILEFLKTWLNRHILDEDMRYRPYLDLAA